MSNDKPDTEPGEPVRAGAAPGTKDVADAPSAAVVLGMVDWQFVSGKPGELHITRTDGKTDRFIVRATVGEVTPRVLKPEGGGAYEIRFEVSLTPLPLSGSVAEVETEVAR